MSVNESLKVTMNVNGKRGGYDIPNLAILTDKVTHIHTINYWSRLLLNLGYAYFIEFINFLPEIL